MQLGCKAAPSVRTPKSAPTTLFILLRSNNLNRTATLYNKIHPDVQATFTQASPTFKNGHTIWDLLNVTSIHNKSASIPDGTHLSQLGTLADQHDFSRAYNVSEQMRAVTRSVLAAEVVSALVTTIITKGQSEMNIQFGAYNGMLSFFGLSKLTSIDSDFYGVPDYAGSLT